jgi:methionyl aminopeptidase
MAIPIRKPKEIDALRTASLAVADTLAYLKENISVGMTLLEVDRLGEEYLRSLGARPSFKGLYGFPNAICTSLNQVIIHGIPDNRVLKSGDILGIDIGSEINGWYGDAAITLPIGKISCEDTKLIDCAKETLDHAVESIRTGMRFKELSLILEKSIVDMGYKPLLNYCGHGIGKKPHGEPEIPNYLDGKDPKSGPKIKDGMVFCIEPMVCQENGTPKVLEDKWSVTSVDGLNGSHYEHTIAVINGKAEVLTKR